MRAQNQVIDRAPAVSSKVGVLLPISSAPRPAPRAVLVVHEDAADADRYRDALSSPELEVTTTTDVASAMRAAPRWDAVLIDLAEHSSARRVIASLDAGSSAARPRLVGLRARGAAPWRAPECDVVVALDDGLGACTTALGMGRPLSIEASALAPLVGHHLLDADEAGADQLTKALGEAFDAEAAIFWEGPSDTSSSWPPGASAGSRLRAHVVEAAGWMAPLLVSEGGKTATIVGVSSSDAPSVAPSYLGLRWAGARADAGACREILAPLCRRLAEERAVVAVRTRLAAELEAVRDVGGLDPMLGVWNRGTLSRLLQMMLNACRRGNEPLAISVLNVVDMARINDVYGHREGDALLRHVAEVAVYVVRGSDVVARYEDDDLALVFPGANAEQAAMVVGRIRRTIASQPVRTDDGSDITVATTAGVSVVGDHENDAEGALARAAEAASGGDDPAGVATAYFDARHTIDGGFVPASRRSFSGATFGGTYRILHEIGSGGGGGVFRGEDLGLRRPVAVKVLRATQSQDEALVERFRSEAATLAALRHPNLVQVYAFGVEDGHAYFVMELVEGESIFDAVIRARKEDRELPRRRLLVVLDQIASALRTLHAAGIIHRDVKPANILTDPFRDRAVLVDVGIASRSGEEADLAGTPGYMAPEAAVVTNVDATVDVYGLAVTLYEMLTLELPWEISESPIITVNNQRHEPPVPPSSHDRALAPLDEPLLRAMSADPSERWPDVAAFVAAVRGPLAVLAAEPSSETPPKASAPVATSRSSEERQSRGVIFRTLARVVGARRVAAWRLELNREHGRLAEVLSPATPPLGWLATRQLVELLTTPPTEYEQKATIGRDLGRASVRATFRRFFPASSATLAPSGTLAALPSIWPRYHSWGVPRVAPHLGDRVTVVLSDPPPEPCLRQWTIGALEQLVLLSGAEDVTVEPIDDPSEPEHWTLEVRFDYDPSSRDDWRP
ncbi:MAG: protein kinase [Polyangiaceae bacterium]